MKRFVWVAGPFLAAAIPLLFCGYGSDADIYGELDAARKTWGGRELTLSRTPGYWLHEAFLLAASVVGGAALANAVTLLVSVAVLHRSWVFAGRLGVNHRVPLILCVALNPWFLRASTSANDYNWALLFILLAIERLRDRRHRLGSLAGGASVWFRLGSLFPLAGAALGRFIAAPGDRRALESAFFFVVVTLLGSLLYIPSWFASGGNFAFLKGGVGPDDLWTLKMHLGRAVYKPIYLFGLVTSVCLAALVAVKWRETRRWLDETDRDLAILCAGAALGTGALFLRYPIEISYLLPALPCFVLLGGLLLRRAPAWQAWLLVATTVSYWFVSIPLASPNVPARASDATFGIKIEEGVLVRDLRMRVAVLDCNTLQCYEERIGPTGEVKRPR